MLHFELEPAEDKHAQIKLEVKARSDGGGVKYGGESLMPTKSKNVGAENNQKYYVMHERQGQHCCWPCRSIFT